MNNTENVKEREKKRLAPFEIRDRQLIQQLQSNVVPEGCLVERRRESSSGCGFETIQAVDNLYRCLDEIFYRLTPLLVGAVDQDVELVDDGLQQFYERERGLDLLLVRRVDVRVPSMAEKEQLDLLRAVERMTQRRKNVRERSAKRLEKAAHSASTGPGVPASRSLKSPSGTWWLRTPPWSQ